MNTGSKEWHSFSVLCLLRPLSGLRLLGISFGLQECSLGHAEQLRDGVVEALPFGVAGDVGGLIVVSLNTFYLYA